MINAYPSHTKSHISKASLSVALAGILGAVCSSHGADVTWPKAEREFSIREKEDITSGRYNISYDFFPSEGSNVTCTIMAEDQSGLLFGGCFSTAALRLLPTNEGPPHFEVWSEQYRGRWQRSMYAPRRDTYTETFSEEYVLSADDTASTEAIADLPNDLKKIGITKLYRYASKSPPLDPGYPDTDPSIRRKLMGSRQEQSEAIQRLAEEKRVAPGYVDGLIVLFERSNTKDSGDLSSRLQSLASRTKLPGILANCGEAAVPKLKELMKDPEQVYWVLGVFEDMGTQCLSALDEITKALKSENPSTVTRALSVLDNLGTAGTSALPEVIRLLDSKNEDIRSDAVNILPTFGKKAMEAIPKLQEMAKSDDLDVQYQGENGLELIKRFVE